MKTNVSDVKLKWRLVSHESEGIKKVQSMANLPIGGVGLELILNKFSINYHSFFITSQN